MGRKSPWRGARRYEDFRQNQVQRFGNYLSDAKNHVIGRNQAVATTLCYLSMMRNAGEIPLPFTAPEPQPVEPPKMTSLITTKGAEYQTIRGAKALSQEAAHCLPCQVLVSGLKPEKIEIGGKPLPTRVQDNIRAQFGKVTILDRCFNVADKAAERNEPSLARAFADACRRVIDCPRESDSPRQETRRGVGERYGELYTIEIWPINRKHVREIYASIWLPGAERAYTSAGNEIEKSGKYLSAEDNPDEILWILEKYVDNHYELPTALRDDQMSNLELELAASSPSDLEPTQ
jgi:hypothetical protein